MTGFIRALRKYKDLIPRELWKKLPIVVIVMVLAGFLEMLSVSLMLPFMNVVVNRRDSENWYIRAFRKGLNITSDKTFIISVSVTLALIYILKALFLLWETKYQKRFVAECRVKTQEVFLGNLLNRSYEYFMDKSTGKILTVFGYVPMVYSSLSLVLSMFSELVTSFMLILALFMITPRISTLISSGLIILLLVIAKIIKPQISRAADAQRESAAGMNKWCMQSIQGIKEVKIEGSKGFFLRQYDKNSWINAETDCRYQVLLYIPRLLIEAVTMSAFFLTIAIHVGNDKDLSQMIPVISVVAMAAMRLLPATNRISTAISTISYTDSFNDELLMYMYDQISDMSGNNSSHSEDSNNWKYENEIEMKNISYHYPNNPKAVLEDANIIIKKGDIIGIVGSSGAGKTTAVDIILGLLNPQTGRVTVDGIDIQNDMASWLSHIGYIPQSIFMLDDSIKMNVAFGIDKDDIDDNMVWEALEKAALGDFVKKLPEGIDTQIGERGMKLSGGQRQRIGIARALYRNPQVLFFDEATSALDNETEGEIMASINNLIGEKTMIIIAHRLSTIKNCNHVYKVENAKIIEER